MKTRCLNYRYMKSKESTDHMISELTSILNVMEQKADSLQNNQYSYLYKDEIELIKAVIVDYRNVLNSLGQI